jgi:hypothetical protein
MAISGLAVLAVEMVAQSRQAARKQALEIDLFPPRPSDPGTPCWRGFGR